MKSEPKMAKGLRLEDWPTKDRTAWIRASKIHDLLDDNYYSAGLAPATVEAMQLAYGRWLGWVATRRPELLTSPLLDRLNRETAVAYLTELRLSITDISINGYLGNLRCAVRAMSPGSDLSWLGQISSRIRRTMYATRDKSRRVVESQQLVELGVRLMSEAGDIKRSISIEQAVIYRDGLMIALLAARPLRTRNFIGLEIGNHLVEHAGGWWVRIPTEETKNRIAIEFPLPIKLLPKLTGYLQLIRPLLLQQNVYRDPRFAFRQPSSKLWVSRTGSALSKKTFYSTVTRRTKKQFWSLD